MLDKIFNRNQIKFKIKNKIDGSTYIGMLNTETNWIYTEMQDGKYESILLPINFYKIVPYVKEKPKKREFKHMILYTY